MQQPPGVMNMMPQFPPANITTEQIQKYLDENKKLILAILDNQNLGKLAECAQYQAQLQKNLMYLAAIADAQPPAPAVPVPSQISAHPAMQQGGHYMQHPQAAMGQQPSGFPSKIPMQFNPQQMQEQQQQLQQQQLQHQHQQAIQGHLGMRPVVSNGLQGMHGEVNHGGGSGIGPSTTSGVTEYTRSCAGAGVSASASVGATPGVAGGGGASSNPTHAQVGKQDGKEVGSSEAQGNTAAGNSSEKANTKGSGDA